MNLKYAIKTTPNPNAKKFIFNQDIKANEKVSFTKDETYDDIPLIKALFSIPNIIQIHIKENLITITISAEHFWQEIEPSVIKSVKDNLAKHNIYFQKEKSKSNHPPLPAKWQQIDDILEEAIRPSLQNDGGDLTIYKYSEKDNLLVVDYEGACVSCPSATLGTLMAIKNTLMQKYDPHIRVMTKEQFDEQDKEQ